MEPTDREAVEAEAEERYVKRHACCCKSCPLRLELWAAFWIDMDIFTGGLYELPWHAPADTHLFAWFILYIFGIVFPALCLLLWVLFNKNRSGWPRRLLVQYFIYKIPAFFWAYVGYFSLSPWATGACTYLCTYIPTLTASLGKGDLQKCATRLPWFMESRNMIYVVIYCYTLKGAYEYFRCHPDNDDKGILSSRTSAREGMAVYEPMLA
ncbi:unnamed protein product [Polarella glacialis]|uniref:Uncharacterized protein n=1 Tax=Polarella glacialis TaxID=89957 RepID=A0A813HFT2_POLGL|nr:unnamed protein product [Polarella glacialis]